MLQANTRLKSMIKTLIWLIKKTNPLQVIIEDTDTGMI